MNPNPHNFSRSPRRVRSGFSLIELLVVIGIIVILIAIIVPSVGHFRDEAKIAATKSTLANIQQALDAYYTDFRQYPSSNSANDGYAGTIGPGRGPAMLAQGLMGYMSFNKDGAGADATTPSAYTNEPALGFRIRGSGASGTAPGKIYGPYAPDDPKFFVNNNPSPTGNDTDRSFYDGYGNEILYYRSSQTAIDNTGATTPKLLFDLSANADSYFVVDDDEALPPPAATGNKLYASPLDDDTSQNPAKPHPLLTLLGRDNNVLSSATGSAPIPGLRSYLLISAGKSFAPISNYISSNTTLPYYSASAIVVGGH